VLQLARLDEHRPSQQDAVDLAALARDAAADARAVDPRRPVSVCGDDQVVVRGDTDRLRQVLANLVDNALVHTPAGTSIELRVTCRAGDVAAVPTSGGARPSAYASRPDSGGPRAGKSGLMSQPVLRLVVFGAEMSDVVTTTPPQVGMRGAPVEADRRPLPRPRPRSRRRRAVVVIAAAAVLLGAHAGWMCWRADQIGNEATNLRVEQARTAEMLDEEQVVLDRTRTEAAGASAALASALASALAALPPGATAASTDADLASSRTALAALQDSLDAATAARAFTSAERDRLVGCLESAEQALGVAQTSPLHTSSLAAVATEACRDASTGVFSTIAGR
jgi:hypothetical protein